MSEPVSVTSHSSHSGTHGWRHVVSATGLGGRPAKIENSASASVSWWVRLLLRSWYADQPVGIALAAFAPFAPFAPFGDRPVGIAVRPSYVPSVP